jgi:hypothetical protein
MTRREAGAGLLSAAAAAVVPAVTALAAQPVVLPAPRSQGGKPLIEALRLRRSIRKYSERPLPPQVLSDLLWAAFGVNRPSGDRTAPYWRHIMVIDLYAGIADGVWLYDPKQHALVPHLSADTSSCASLSLAYVAHGERMQMLPKSAGSTRRTIPASSARIFTFSVRPKASRCSAARWLIASLSKPCSSTRDSSLLLRRQWAIPTRQPYSFNLMTNSQAFTAIE